MAQMGEHRVPMLGSLRRFEDPAHSADPEIRAVVAGLRTLEVAPPPRAHFRAELRAQLVAVAPRLIAEGVTAETSATPAATAAAQEKATRPERRSLRQALRIPVGRPLGIVTAVVAIFGLLLGGAVLLSRNALPGDALYGLKRAGENLQLATASGPTDKANDLLEFAANRVKEVDALLADAGARAGAPAAPSGDTASLVASTLGSADSDVRQASRLLGNAAVRQHSAAPLTAMVTWSPRQITRLQGVLDRLAPGTVHDRATASLALVRAAQQRAGALAAVVACACMNQAHSDSLGPVPCTTCTTGTGTPSAPSVPSQPGTTPQHPGGTGAPSGTHRGGTHANTPTGSGTTPVNGGSSGGSGNPVNLPTLPTLPGLPLPGSSSVPVNRSSLTVDSCGTSVSLGPIGIGAGGCGSQPNLGP